jgi:hypothetical protein
MANFIFVYFSKISKKNFKKALSFVTKTTVNVLINFNYCGVELERKLLNKIVEVANDTKPLASLF